MLICLKRKHMSTRERGIRKETFLMKKTYKIDVDCANCANKMEVAANGTAGVKNATVNFMALKMSVEFEEGADAKAEAARFHGHSGAGDHSGSLHLVHPLMDGRARDSALARYLQKRRSGIVHQHREYLPVRLVQCTVGHSVYFFFVNLRNLRSVGLLSAIIFRQSSSVRLSAAVPRGIL